MRSTEKAMDQIAVPCRSRDFVYLDSEIYDSLANPWNYGPLGVGLKNNVERTWQKKFAQENLYSVGLDAAIPMNPEV